MKIVAKRAVQLGGHIYRKGEACEWEGAVTERIAANFEREDGAALEAKDGDAGAAVAEGPTDEEKVARVVAVMRREGIVQALDAMGVAYGAKAKTEALARTLLVAKGEIV